MALVPGDWTIDRLTKKFAYIGGDHGASPSYATVIQFHRWAQSLADDAVATGDEELDITNTDPSRRSTDNIVSLINGYTLDETPGTPASEHLYDGSIIQGGGTDIWDGIVNFGNDDVQIQIHQDGAVLADDWWNFGGAGLNPDATAGISHRFMLPVRTSGVDIDNRKLLGTCRRFNYTYGEFPINATARGNNVLALSDSLDLNNETIPGTVLTWTTIVNITEGYAPLDVNNDTIDEFYYSEWNKDTYSINQFYERMKWLTRDGSVETLYGLNGELFRGITHQVAISAPAGTFVEPESLAWGIGATAGTGQLLAIDSVTAGTKMWIQLKTGVTPTGTITGSGTATAGAITPREISKPFVGVSTGSALIGSYGLALEVLDLTSLDKLTDLGGNPVSPPNYVTNTISGLTFAGDADYVLVGPWNGAATDTNGDPAITKDQLSLDVALAVDNVTQVEVTEPIPSDTPATGTIRVTDDLGFERRLHYVNWENGTPNRFYNIDTVDGNEDFLGNEAAIGNDVWISYIDQPATAATASFTSVQSGTRQLVALVRNGGSAPIKQFISEWSQTSSAQTLNAIRNTDV